MSECSSEAASKSAISIDYRIKADTVTFSYFSFNSSLQNKQTKPLFMKQLCKLILRFLSQVTHFSYSAYLQL